MSPKIASYDEFLASVGEVKAKTVHSVFEVAREAYPELTTKIAWNVPNVQYQGKYVMGISCAKSHISISLWSADVLAAFHDRLSEYDPTENLFRVPVDWQVDAALIVDMVGAKIAEIQRG